MQTCVQCLIHTTCFDCAQWELWFSRCRHRGSCKTTVVYFSKAAGIPKHTTPCSLLQVPDCVGPFNAFVTHFKTSCPLSFTRFRNVPVRSPSKRLQKPEQVLQYDMSSTDQLLCPLAECSLILRPLTTSGNLAWRLLCGHHSLNALRSGIGAALQTRGQGFIPFICVDCSQWERSFHCGRH